YRDAQTLRGEGMSYRRIVSELAYLHGVKLDRSRMSFWLRGLQTPLGRVPNPALTPSPQLAYVIGCILGDGTTVAYPPKHQFSVVLKVKDKEFAEEFARCASCLLRCSRHKLYYYKKRG